MTIVERIPNYPLVHEITEWVQTGKVLKGFTSSPFSSKYLLETNFKRAREYAFSQLIDHANLCWLDIRELEMSNIMRWAYQFPNYEEINQHLRSLTSSFFQTLSKRLPREYRDIAEEISSDMHDCLYNRAYCGKVDNLIEAIFQLYKAGGWPCGWIGHYPEGKMIVFSPQQDTHE